MIAASPHKAHFVAIAGFLNGEQRSLTKAAEVHGIDRKTLSRHYREVIESGLVAPAGLTLNSRAILSDACGKVPELLAEYVQGAVATLQSLPRLFSAMDKDQRAAFKLATEHLDKMGLMPAKPKDEPKASEHSRFIDLIEQPADEAEKPEA